MRKEKLINILFVKNNELEVVDSEEKTANYFRPGFPQLSLKELFAAPKEEVELSAISMKPYLIYTLHIKT